MVNTMLFVHHVEERHVVGHKLRVRIK